MRTDGTLSLEENLRQNLLACYTEFADILKQMAVTHVSSKSTVLLDTDQSDLQAVMSA